MPKCCVFRNSTTCSIQIAYHILYSKYFSFFHLDWWLWAFKWSQVSLNLSWRKHQLCYACYVHKASRGKHTWLLEDVIDITHNYTLNNTKIISIFRWYSFLRTKFKHNFSNYFVRLPVLRTGFIIIMIMFCNKHFFHVFANLPAPKVHCYFSIDYHLQLYVHMPHYTKQPYLIIQQN